MEEDFQAHLEARVARLQDDTGLTGVVAAVMTDGRLAGAAASGERRRGSGIPVTVDDRWHVGSITKSMTATLLAVLENDGLLSADDTVSALLPEVELADGWGGCTLHHLLTHTAGAPADFPTRVQSIWPENPEELVAARRRFVADILAKEPASPCGERFAYSNVGYTIAGHIAETVAGKPYESLLQERVFGPLMLASAGFGPPQGDGPNQEPIARGWVRVERDWAGGPVLWHNGSNTMWYALLMLLPARNTVLAFATNDGAIQAAETAFVELARELGAPAPGS